MSIPFPSFFSNFVENSTMSSISQQAKVSNNMIICYNLLKMAIQKVVDERFSPNKRENRATKGVN